MRNATSAMTTDVVILRRRFALTLALMLAGGFLAGEGFAFSPATSAWIGFGVGIVALVLACALSLTVRRARSRVAAWDVLAAVAAVIGSWQIVQSLVFAASTSKW